MTQAYVYYLKHIPTGLFYYGARFANVRKNIAPEDDLWIKYFTSSKKVKELKKQDDNFEIKILFKSNNFDEVYWYEQECIKNSIIDELSLNRYYINKETNQKIFSFHNKRHSEESLTKMKGRQPWNTGLSAKDTPSLVRGSSWNKGIPTPEETKKYIAEKTRGIKKSEETKEKMRKPKSESHRKHQSDAAFNRPRFPCEICGRLITHPNIENHRKSHK